MKKIWLSPPLITGKETAYVEDAIQSGWVAPAGTYLTRFAEKIKENTKSNHVALVNTGTAAIHLALKVLGIPSGAKVACSNFTFIASANPIKYIDAVPVFIGSEENTWNMDPDFLEEAIIEGKKKDKPIEAIIWVHAFGTIGEAEKIKHISVQYNIPLIEDAAEALGSYYSGVPAGSLGKVGILSFNGNKIVTTSGGGALISNDEKLVEDANYLSAQAKDENETYLHQHIGYNYQMSNISAALGYGQIIDLEMRVKKKRQLFEVYRDNLQSRFIFQPESENGFSNRWLTCAYLEGMKSEHLIQALENEGIEARHLYRPMTMQPLFKDCDYFGSGYEQILFKYGIALPSGVGLNSNEQERIIATIKKQMR